MEVLRFLALLEVGGVDDSLTRPRGRENRSHCRRFSAAAVSLSTLSKKCAFGSRFGEILEKLH